MHVYLLTLNVGGAKGADDDDGAQGEEFHLAILLWEWCLFAIQVLFYRPWRDLPR